MKLSFWVDFFMIVLYTRIKCTFINEIYHTILMDKIGHTNAIDHLDEIINMDDHSQNT